MVNEWFEVEWTPIRGTELRMTVNEEEKGWFDLCVSGELAEAAAVGDWHVQIRPRFEPDFFYTPHLTPEEDHVIDMHVFRTPVMMMGCTPICRSVSSKGSSPP